MDENLNSQTISPHSAVDSLNKVFGRHESARASHAKGFFVQGEFSLAEATSYLFMTNHKTGPIPTIGRFSIGGGNPNVSDTSRSVRGMAIRLRSDSDEILDLSLISAPTFFAATPQQFVEFLKAREPVDDTNKPDPDRVKAFNEANPNIKPHLEYVASTPPPLSYASTSYHSTHSFIFDRLDATPQPARWHFEPVLGTQRLDADQELNFPFSYLREELSYRLAKMPVEWIAYLHLPAPGDSITDPSSPWKSRPDGMIEVGRLKINKLVQPDEAGELEHIIFDPNNLPIGICATNDPILRLRSDAYDISYARRII